MMININDLNHSDLLRDCAEEALREVCADQALVAALVTHKAHWPVGYNNRDNYMWAVPEAPGVHYKVVSADHLGFRWPWGEFHAWKRKKEKEINGQD